MLRYKINFCFVAMLLMVTSAAADTKRVLLLNSFGPDSSNWFEYTRAVRGALVRKTKDPIDFYETALVEARSANANEKPFTDYLLALLADGKPDLVVAVGGPAVNFMQRYRQKLFPEVPAVYTAFEQRRIAPAQLTANDVVVALALDLPAIFENMLKVLPDTQNIMVVLGASPLERFWRQQLEKDLRGFSERVKISYTNDLSFDGLLKQAAELPPHSVIFFGLLSVDVSGASYNGMDAVERLHRTANAPIFTFTDTFFGYGVVGGLLTSAELLSGQTANAAAAILAGKAPEAIKVAPSSYAAPRYDWRELQRWNISESRLPEHSIVDFRVPTFWEANRSKVLISLATVVLQFLVIAALLVERRRRRAAQVEAESRRNETLRLNRVATASVLSSSLSHELNQPLGAILNNAAAGRIFLKSAHPDLALIDEILSDIIRDEKRASDILIGLRNLLRNQSDAHQGDGNLKRIDLNDAVRDVVALLTPEIAKRNIALETHYSQEDLPIRADPIHMQQVLLNLMMNSVDAMERAPRRNLVVRTRYNVYAATANVTISDTGNGIPEDQLSKIFDAFYTTKKNGTGLGLPIARLIVETYGGKIWAENRAAGALFCFSLPFAADARASSAA